MKKKADKIYKDFFGREGNKDFEISLSQMKNLTFLGKAIAIEYEAKKHDDKVKELYRHEFENDQILLTNGKDLIIYGSIKITDRGIEG